MRVSLHRTQRIVFNDQHAVRVLVNGRRWGKSRLMVWELIRASLMFPGIVDPVSTETVIAALPTLKQARKILWKPLFNLATKHPDITPLVYDINKTEYTVYMKYGKPPIMVTGANDSDGDGLRGNRIYYAGLDEAQDMKPGIFDTVIKPAMLDTKGSRALITGTPKGKQGNLWDLFNRQQTAPDFYKSFNFPTWTNPTIDRDEIRRDKLILPERLFRQEYQATFEDFPGKVYSELDEKALVRDLPGKYQQTILGIDFGDTHPSFVVLGLGFDGCWYILTTYSPNTGHPITSDIQIDIIRSLVNTYNPKAIFCDPSRPAMILDIRHKVFDKTVAGYNRIQDGIDQVHSLIHQNKLRFQDSDQKPGKDWLSGKETYQCFMDYHRKTDKNGIVTENIADGQFDHCVDATRYALARKRSQV